MSDMTAERIEQIRERVEKVPTLLAKHRSPWYVTMDGVKDASHIWLFKATGTLDSQIVELANDAARARQDIPDLLAALTTANERAERAEKEIVEQGVLAAQLNRDVLALEAENEKLREALTEIAGSAAPDHHVPQYQHCVDIAIAALRALEDRT